MEDFKQKYSFEERLQMTENILQTYSNRIPVVCEKDHNTSKIKETHKKKYLIPTDLTVGQFVHVIRQRIKIKPEMALFFTINGMLLNPTNKMSMLYNEYKEADNFLYIKYSNENVFGKLCTIL